jgi:hypothetical protein
MSLVEIKSKEGTKLRKIVVLAVSILALSVTVGVAEAAKKKVESEVTIQYNLGNDPYGEDGTFSGEVNALNVSGKKKRKCEKNRTVTVYRVQPGEDPTFGTTKTNGDGEWVISAPDAYDEAGQYYAVVSKKKKNKLNLVCKPDTSPTITVP